MSFLNPFLLFGMAAIGIPVIIHLLNKRKFQHVQWAAMRFLKVSVEQNRRRLKIEDYILLLLRCLLLILLAIALARPALRTIASGGMFGQARIISVLVLDNSYSMSQTNGVTSPLRPRQAGAGSDARFASAWIIRGADSGIGCRRRRHSPADLRSGLGAKVRARGASVRPGHQSFQAGGRMRSTS